MNGRKECFCFLRKRRNVKTLLSDWWLFIRKRICFLFWRKRFQLLTHFRVFKSLRYDHTKLLCDSDIPCFFMWRGNQSFHSPLVWFSSNNSLMLYNRAVIYNIRKTNFQLKLKNDKRGNKIFSNILKSDYLLCIVCSSLVTIFAEILPRFIFFTCEN